MDKNKFNQIASDVFQIPLDQVKDGLTAKDLPSWDSMNYLIFIAELEKNFGVSFSMQEVTEADSLGSIKKILQSKGLDV